MKISDAAARMAELGNENRLSIFRLLVKTRPKGLAVGEIGKILEIPGSTLSHHISRLMRVGLVEQQRESRTLYCVARIEAVKELSDFLVSECCSGNTSAPGWPG